MEHCVPGPDYRLVVKGVRRPEPRAEIHPVVLQVQVAARVTSGDQEFSGLDVHARVNVVLYDLARLELVAQSEVQVETAGNLPGVVEEYPQVLLVLVTGICVTGTSAVFTAPSNRSAQVLSGLFRPLAPNPVISPLKR